MNWEHIAAVISQTTGRPFFIKDHSSIGGGCINSAAKLVGKACGHDHSQHQQYFIKFNSADLLDMFVAEAEGLQALGEAHAVHVPGVICHGSDAAQAYLVLEYIEFGRHGSMSAFGEQLAAMHRYTKDKFGWQRENTIGSTPQVNTWHHDWVQFWRELRLGFQLELALQNGIKRQVYEKGQSLAEQLDMFFTDYQPVASVLHGDLWSGNYAMDSEGQAVIFDPAVYFGDRETDLAMSELFGGFSRDFYAAYAGTWPIDPGYKVRKTLYNLYHILNHFNLFGGGYAGQAQSMIDSLLSELK